MPLNKNKKKKGWLSSIKHKEIKKNLLPILAILLILIILLTVLLVSNKQDNKRDNALELDGNLCPVDKTRIQDYAAVILDVSEPLQGINAEQLIAQVFDLAKTLPRYSNLVIFDALEVTTGNKFILSRCISDGIDDCRDNPSIGLTKNCNRVLKRYHDTFEAPLKEQLITFLGNQKVSKTSPVIESISSVAALTEFKQAQSRKIYIFSDMLQNMKSYSHYKAGMPEDEFEKLSQRPYYQDIAPDLDGADVNVFYILRKKNARMQTRAHKKFWDDFFVATSTKQPINLIDWNFASDTASASAGAEINLEDASSTPENLLPGQKKKYKNDAHNLQYPDLSQGIYFTKDIILVLDNSGSMRKNDPNFLLKKAVTDFIKHQGEADRIAIIKFDQVVDMLVPLDKGSLKKRRSIVASLKKINYQGQFTDSPAAIEKAVYELKTNARQGVKRVIIFMTDGIVDTGNAHKDLTRTQWLKEDLMLSAEKNGIKVFGIAFSESADFQLLQSITQQTGGEYYRASKAEDLEKVLIRVTRDINGG